MDFFFAVSSSGRTGSNNWILPVKTNRAYLEAIFRLSDHEFDFILCTRLAKASHQAPSCFFAICGSFIFFPCCSHCFIIIYLGTLLVFFFSFPFFNIFSISLYFSSSVKLSIQLLHFSFKIFLSFFLILSFPFLIVCKIICF